MSTKYVYLFAEGQVEGNGTMRDLLGGKGAGLAEMINAGLPVPPGFTVTHGGLYRLLQGRREVPGGVVGSGCRRR
jgi:pyruvate,orthophosphate dikinase